MKKVTLKAIKNMEGYTVYSDDDLQKITTANYDKDIRSKSKDFYSTGTYGINGLCATVTMTDGTVHKIKIVGRKTELFWF